MSTANASVRVIVPLFRLNRHSAIPNRPFFLIANNLDWLILSPLIEFFSVRPGKTQHLWHTFDSSPPGSLKLLHIERWF